MNTRPHLVTNLKCEKLLCIITLWDEANTEYKIHWRSSYTLPIRLSSNLIVSLRQFQKQARTVEYQCNRCPLQTVPIVTKLPDYNNLHSIRKKLELSWPCVYNLYSCPWQLQLLALAVNFATLSLVSNSIFTY